MVLSQWPASERPRERFIAEGANKLTDAELIALVLHTGVRGRSTVDLARSLLTEYGGLANLLCADSKRLLSSPGIGEARRYPRAVPQASRRTACGPQCTREFDRHAQLFPRALPRLLPR
jgi:DNA repair protein RadC